MKMQRALVNNTVPQGYKPEAYCQTCALQLKDPRSLRRHNDKKHKVKS